MPKTTCSIDECERPAKGRGWCRAHYMHWYTYGDPGSGPVRAWGRKSCAMDDCDRPHYIDGYCRPHAKRIKLHGDPGPVDVKPQTVGDNADYRAVHLRLRKGRGPARDRSCVGCGGPARHWAYDHRDPDEKTDTANGLVFSLDPDHYQPMCPLCHKRFDLAHANGTPSHLIELSAHFADA